MDTQQRVAGAVPSLTLPVTAQVDDIYSDELKPEERPAVIAVVDVSGSEESVEVTHILPRPSCRGTHASITPRHRHGSYEITPVTPPKARVVRE